MSDAPDSLTRPKAQPVEVNSEAIASFAKDLSSAFMESGVATPVNAAIQLANHTAHTHLPEFTLKAPEHQNLATIAGSMLGAAADMVLVNRALSPVFDLAGLAPTTLLGTTLRMGTTGAVFSGLLSPTSDSSQTFAVDRLKNAAVGFGTFAAMGAAGYGIGKSNLFAMEQGRTFVGSVFVGAISGAPAGAVHAQLDSFIYKHQTASWNDTVAQAKTFAEFGAAYGAAGWAVNKGTSIVQSIIDSRPSRFNYHYSALMDSDHGRATVTRDASGNVVKLAITQKHVNDWFFLDDMKITPEGQVESIFERPDGTWGSQLRFPFLQSWKNFFAFSVVPMPGKPVDSVTQSADGTVTIHRTGHGAISLRQGSAPPSRAYRNSSGQVWGYGQAIEQ